MKRIELAGVALATTVLFGGCTVEQGTKNKSANEITVFQSGQNMNCYTDKAPVLTLEGTKVDVKVTDALCYGDTNLFGISTNVKTSAEIIADGATLQSLSH